MARTTQLTLGNQSSLPNNVAIRLAQLEEMEYDGNLVSTTSYFKKEPKMRLSKITSMIPPSLYQSPITKELYRFDIIPYGS